jgi:hypothetical protein
MERTVVTPGKITGYFIENFILRGILIGLFAGIIQGTLFSFIKVDNVTLQTILKTAITLFITAGGLFFLTYWSTSSAFKLNTIKTADVPKLLKNIIIFFVIMLILNGILSFNNAQSTVKEVVNSEYSYRITLESIINHYSDQQISEKKQELINQATKHIYVYFIVLEAFVVLIYFFLILFQRKLLLKYCED